MGSPLHIISAQICELGITLASEAVEAKSNEIPAVQELLKKLDIEGCLVVADALTASKKPPRQSLTERAIICWMQKAISVPWDQKSLNMFRTIRAACKFPISLLKQYKARIASRRVCLKQCWIA